jgi:DNA polymerase I-like protein with 3'-5' exonuclease and polymerase domains
MKLLINTHIRDKNYLSILQYYLRKNGFTAIATSETYEPGQLIEKAIARECKGILIINENTLKNCLPENNPSLSKHRGSRLNFSVPTIVCDGLSSLVTIPHGPFLLENDLNKLKSKEIFPVFSFDILESISDFEPAYEFLSQCVLMSYDIETITITEKGIVFNTEIEEENDEETSNENIETCNILITCCAWSGLHQNGEIKTFVLPLIDFTEAHWTSSAYEKAIEFLRKVNNLPVPKTMHNGMYDTTQSIIYRAFPRNWTLDTMGMAWSQYSSLPKTLDFVASITLPDYKQWKYESDLARRQKDINAYWRYNAKDAYTTLRITLHYLQHLPPYARRNYATQFKLVYPFLYCGLEGFLVDNNKREELRSVRSDRLNQSLIDLKRMFGNEDFNPASPQQLQYYLYDIFQVTDPHIGYKKDPKTRKRTRNVRSTDAKNLAEIQKQHPIYHRIISKILEYRKDAKAIATYFDFLQLNNRMLYSINPFGTDSGRCSSSKFQIHYGTQVQNIPPYAKPCFIPDPGFILAEPDNSQSEARCTAYLAQETNFIEALETPGKDFYRTLGTLLFMIPYDDVSTDFRNKVLKKINHGASYMMKEQTFIESAGLENIKLAAIVLGVALTERPRRPDEMTIKAFAAMLLEKYHGPFPRLRQWYEEIKTTISETNKLISPLGWTRYFFGDITKNYQLFSSAVAQGPQNLSVMILNIGLWKNWVLTKENPKDFRLKAQIHDSAPFQYRIGREDLRDKAIRNFENPVVVHGRTLRIPVDFKEGPNWGDLKK